MTKSINISNGSDLAKFLLNIDSNKFDRNEDVIIKFKGDFAKQISKTYAAYFNRNRGKVLGYGGAAGSAIAIASALAIPTSGLSLFIGGVIGTVVGVTAADQSDEAYNAMPYAKEIIRLREKNFLTTLNDGYSLTLTRRGVSQ
jgi:hypothetical protein